MTTHNEDIFAELFNTLAPRRQVSTEDKVDAVLANANIAVVRTEDLAAVLHIAASLLGEVEPSSDPIVLSLLWDAFYRLNDEVPVVGKTAAEVVSEH